MLKTKAGLSELTHTFGCGEDGRGVFDFSNHERSFEPLLTLRPRLSHDLYHLPCATTYTLSKPERFFGIVFSHLLWGKGGYDSPAKVAAYSLRLFLYETERKIISLITPSHISSLDAEIIENAVKSGYVRCSIQDRRLVHLYVVIERTLTDTITQMLALGTESFNVQ